MTIGLAHLKWFVVIVAAFVLYALADIYRVPIGCVILFTAIGAVLAAMWDKLTSFAAS